MNLQRQSIAGAVAFGIGLIVATTAFAVQVSDWRGIPRGAFIDPSSSDASGVGDAPRIRVSVLNSTSAPGLQTIGNDVIRFSSSPLRAKNGFIIQVHRDSSGAIIGTVTTLALGGSGWTQTEVRRFTISTSDYDKLAAMIDAVLAEPVRPFKGEEVIACADDPGFLTERLSDGTARWLSGSMTVPNYAIAKALITATGVPAFDPAPLPLGGCVKRG